MEDLPSEYRDTAKNVWNEFLRCRNDAEALWAHVRPPELRFYTHGAAAGMYHRRTRKVSINVGLMRKGGAEAIANTVSHEYAHAVAETLELGTGHGLLWKKVHRALGGSGNRCHTISTEGVKARRTRKYYWITKSGREVPMGAIQHKRALRGTVYRVCDTGENLVEFTGKHELS